MADEKKKNKKHHTVRPYIVVPAVFVLIALTVVAPLSYLLLQYSVSTVHRVQTVFVRSASDIALNDSAYAPSSTADGSVAFPDFKAGDKAAQLTCEQTGMNCSVYFGDNRISRRSGAGLSTRHALMGEKGVILIRGNTAGAFKNLEEMREGDTVTLRAGWGVFTYRVKDVLISGKEPEDTQKETLVLTTQKDKQAFASYSGDKLYVICEKVSGPVLEEVKG